MSNNPIVRVEVTLAERSYDIDIGTQLLSEAGSLSARRGKLSHAVLIVDEHVTRYADQVEDGLRRASIRCDRIVIPSGEASKSIDQAARLWQAMLDCGADRRTAVFAVGGGVVGDLAGFAAASYARGLRFCQIPTTLLAQVDSSVGGKVGINLPSAKNMVGAFWQPFYVLIDTAVLDSLPDREYRSGLAEVVKYGVILDADFFQLLTEQVSAIGDRDPEVLRNVIARCCQLKADVVQADERETTGLRAVLNFGHTFAHAFESVCGYGTLLHGEAVSIGMSCAARLSERLGRTSAQLTADLELLLQRLQLPTRVPEADVNALIDVMSHDKKVEHGQLRFVLPTRLGHVELVPDVDTELVRSVLIESR